MTESSDGRLGKRGCVVLLGTFTVLAGLSFATNGLWGLLALLIIAALGLLILDLTGVRLNVFGIFKNSPKQRHLPVPTPAFLVGIVVLSSWAYWFSGVEGVALVFAVAIIALAVLRGRFERIRLGVLTLIGIIAMALRFTEHLDARDLSAVLYFFFLVIATSSALEIVLLIGCRDESKQLQLALTVLMAILLWGLAVFVISLVFLRGGRLASVILIVLAVACHIVSVSVTWLIATRLRPQFDILGNVVTQLRTLAPVLGAACSGFVLITLSYGGFYAALFRKVSASFVGLPKQPTFIDFWYFSVVTCGTLGYGDIVPYTRAAKVLVSLELFTGLA